MKKTDGTQKDQADRSAGGAVDATQAAKPRTADSNLETLRREPRTTRHYLQTRAHCRAEAKLGHVSAHQRCCMGSYATCWREMRPAVRQVRKPSLDMRTKNRGAQEPKAGLRLAPLFLAPRIQTDM